MNSVKGYLKTYEQMQIRSSSSSRLICILHEKCVNYISRSLCSGPPLQRNFIDRALNILATLEQALKVEDDISDGLFCLYDYCYSVLDENNNIEKQNAVRMILTQLRDTFNSLYKKQ
ncbi:MAG TPA: flagellar protein FliS [Chitinispirillaceae bacterium]|nr:flagellar protein FliS [Chitinispirillaceae bacterium]